MSRIDHPARRSFVALTRRFSIASSAAAALGVRLRRRFLGFGERSVAIVFSRYAPG